MARNRAGSAPNGAHRTSESASSSLTGHPLDQMPTIRLLPHQDPRSTRPSLSFPVTSRTLPHEDCVIRVGRYSERDVNPNPPPHTPSSAPVGFKSKVVSRRHCEFWCSQGQWYIKDVKSSSGTFLNHIRLSQPSAESKPFPVHDGDVVQLGIDFRGGEEMIFRCVKIRVECNRAWQKTINNYNVKTHKQLRDLGKTATKKDSDTTSSHSSECSICLMSIAPCQSLFVAPCSHVWHYKCIRPILNDHKSWPQFLCPNCRAITDLEADIEDPEDGDWEEENGSESSSEMTSTRDTSDMLLEQEGIVMSGEDEGLSNTTSRLLSVKDDDQFTPSVVTSTDEINSGNSTQGLLTRRGARRISPPFARSGERAASKTTTGAVQYLRPITPTQPLLGTEDFNESALRTPTTDMLIHDGPMTPTNNAGPFVFDGSAGRRAHNGKLPAMTLYPIDATMPPTIAYPLRMLLLSAPGTSPSFLKDISHYDIQTSYYNAAIPIWRDKVPTSLTEIETWRKDWLGQEAGEVVQAVGAWLVCFRKPREKADLDTISKLLAAIQEVVSIHTSSGYSSSEPLLLAVGTQQTLSPSVVVTHEEWENLCMDCGSWEWIDAEVSGKSESQGESRQERNEFGEKVGIERLKEALEACEWDGVNLDNKSDDFGLEDGFGAEAGELEREMKDLRTAGIGAESDDVADDGVEQLERMMMRMQAIKDMGADIPTSERRKFAAKAVREVMKAL